MTRIPVTPTSLNLRPCAEPTAMFAAILDAARRTGIEIPANLFHYDVTQYPHWDFLLRYAQRRRRCACNASWEQQVYDAEATARIYLDEIMVREIGRAVG